MIRTPDFENCSRGFSYKCSFTGFFGTTLAYIGKLPCVFISVRSAGVLLSIVTKQSIESPNQAKSFLPYFRPDCVENARNGATIAVLFALSEQKDNKKSITDLNFQRLPKKRFMVRRPRERNRIP